MTHHGRELRPAKDARSSSLIGGLLLVLAVCAPGIARAQVCDSYYLETVCEEGPANCAYGSHWATYKHSCASGEQLPTGPVYWQCSEPGCPGIQLGPSGQEACSTGINQGELCDNGIDDDYDGCIDEGCLVGADQCTCTTVCDPPGSCPGPQASRKKSICDPFTGGPEICGNGVDDNCDGTPDEGCSPVGPVFPMPLGPSPKKNSCSAQGGSSAGSDPLLLASRSAVTEPFTDFSVDTGLVRLGLTRTYASNDWAYLGGAVGPFGRGWHHDWEGSLSCTSGKCAVALGGSHGLEFMWSGTAPSLDGAETWQIYTAYSDATARKIDNHAMLARRPSGEWILFNPDGTELHFGTVCDTCSNPATDPVCIDAAAGGRARITRVADAKGNSVNVSYDRPAGLLLGLADTMGHVLRLQSTTACANGLASSLQYDSMLVATYSYAGIDLTEARDADGTILRSYAYDAAGSGRLLAVRNDAGDTVAQFSYDGQGRAIGLVDKAASVAVDYDAPGGIRVTEYFGATSATSVRVLDAHGNATSISDDCACGPARTLAWKDHRLVCVADVQGHVSWRDFDAQGRLTRQAEYASAQLCASPPASLDNTVSREEWRDYGLSRTIAQGVSLPLEVVTGIRRKSPMAWVNYTAETFSYDPAPQSIDPAGYSCQQAPLPTGSVLCRRIESGYTWAASGRVLERHATFYSYDARGRVSRMVGPVNLDYPSASDVTPVEERSYWGDGESLARRGRLHETRRYASPTASPLVTTYDYDAFGAFQVTDPAGGITTVVKDGRGRPVSVLAADGTQTRTRYHADLDPRVMVMPGGGAVRFGYDAFGRLASVEHLSSDPDAPGATPVLAYSEHHAYDAAGNRIHSERRDGQGVVTWSQDREYDVQHRMTRETNPELPAVARTIAYDPSGFLTRVTDELGRATQFMPDALNRVKKVTRLDAPGTPSLDVAQYEYQLYADSLSKVIDGNAQSPHTRYQYDDFGRLLQLDSNNVQSQIFKYDARGNLLERRDSFATVRYTYDGLDRVLTTTAQSWAETITYTYRYDEVPFAGRLTSVVEPERTIRFQYDAVGRLLTETVEENGVPAALVTRHVYGTDGLLSDTTYPSGRQLHFTRDSATGRVTRVQDVGSGTSYADAVTYHPGGPVKGLTFGNGLTLLQPVNKRYEPLGVSSGPLSLGYTPDPAGDVGTVTEGSTTTTFQYDFLDRLSSSTAPLAFGYDGNGNRTAESVGGQSATYTYQFDRVARRLVPGGAGPIPTYGYTYDQEGTLDSVGLFNAEGTDVASAMCLRHDVLKRLTDAGPLPRYIYAGAPRLYDGSVRGYCQSVSNFQSVTARFKYDFRGRRIARWLASTNRWTYVVSDSTGNPISELALVGNAWVPARDYVWLEGRPVAQVEHFTPARAYYHHVDHIGLPRALTNEAGQVVWSATARPYGDLVESTATDPLSGQIVVTNLRLPGQYDERLLGSLGLQGPYYNWNRWYLPGAGRYLELDPIALRGGMNGIYSPDWYNYALGNPLTYTDPAGLCVDACVLEAAAAAGIMALATWYTVCTTSHTCPWHARPTPSRCEPVPVAPPPPRTEICRLDVARTTPPVPGPPGTPGFPGQCVYNCPSGRMHIIPAGPQGCDTTITLPLP